MSKKGENESVGHQVEGTRVKKVQLGPGRAGDRH